MRTQLLPVEFHGDTVVMADFEGQPYVVMRTLATNMGLSWKAQYAKLVEKFASVVAMIATTGEDGKQYQMVCLPLRKLPAWMYSINASKVAEHLRAKIIRYQEECDDVLWKYWTTGSVGAAGKHERRGWLQDRARVLGQLSREKDRQIAQELWNTLRCIDDSLMQETPEAALLAPILRQKPLPGMGEGA